MNTKKAYKRFLFLLTLFVFSCTGGDKGSDPNDRGQNDLHHIKENGVLKVAVGNSSPGYFIYRGEVQGFQYELVNALCADLDVKSEFIVVNNLADAFEGLEKGRFDLVARNITVTPQRQKKVLFTRPIKQIRQVIVQRSKSFSGADSSYLTEPSDLAFTKVYVPSNSSYVSRLRHISDEIGKEIQIVQDSVHSEEQLISMVSQGLIDYTVSNESVAVFYKSTYSNIDVTLRISYPNNISWAVKKGANELKDFMDDWLVTFKQTDAFHKINYRYFIHPDFGDLNNRSYHSSYGGRISDYDEIVKEIARKHGWDWRLISSIMYHESRFNPDAESPGGAIGLMQLMPATSESLGVADIRDPRQNIEGGVLLLNWLDEQYKASIPDSLQRLKFTLASYNVGIGYIKGIQRITAEAGRDSEKWDDNVGYVIKNKSNEFSDNPVENTGTGRGYEAYTFVTRVIESYMNYKNLISE